MAPLSGQAPLQDLGKRNRQDEWEDRTRSMLSITAESPTRAKRMKREAGVICLILILLGCLLIILYIIRCMVICRADLM